MRWPILLCCIVIADFSRAQDTLPSIWSVGVYGEIGSSYRTLNATGDYPEVLVDLDNDITRPTRYWASGVEVIRHINQHISLETGVLMTDRGWGTMTFTEFVGADGVMNDPAVPDISVRHEYHHRYLGVPVMLRYAIGNGALRFAPAIGMSNEVLLDLRQVSYTEQTSGSSRDVRHRGTDGFNTFSITARTELALLWQMTDHLQLRIAPIATYQVTQLYDHDPACHQWTGGALIGMRIGL